MLHLLRLWTSSRTYDVLPAIQIPLLMSFMIHEPVDCNICSMVPWTLGTFSWPLKLSVRSDIRESRVKAPIRIQSVMTVSKPDKMRLCSANELLESQRVAIWLHIQINMTKKALMNQIQGLTNMLFLLMEQVRVTPICIAQYKLYSSFFDVYCV